MCIAVLPQSKREEIGIETGLTLLIPSFLFELILQGIGPPLFSDSLTLLEEVRHTEGLDWGTITAHDFPLFF